MDILRHAEVGYFEHFAVANEHVTRRQIAMYALNKLID